MPNTELLLPSNYSQKVMITTLEQHGLKVVLVPSRDVDMVQIDPEAALECFDGRVANIKNRKKHAYRVPGGSNFPQMLRYGGDFVGFNAGAKATLDAGLRPGTHNDCAGHKSWEEGSLETAIYPLAITEEFLKRYNMTRGDYIKLWVKKFDGKHFDFTSLGKHEENKLLISPFLGLTPRPDPKVLVYNHAISKLLDIPPKAAIATTVEITRRLSSDIDCAYLLAA